MKIAFFSNQFADLHGHGLARYARELFGALQKTSGDTEIIYGGTNKHGVYVSQDSGSTWTSFNQGLECLSMTKLAISEMEPKFLYAGTAYGGVWARTLTNKALPWMPLLLFDNDL